jgi:hypothetical protein
MRILWSDNETCQASILPERQCKISVVVQHLKLPNSEKAVEMKEYWSVSISSTVLE